MAETTRDVWEAIVDDPGEREAARIKSRLMMCIEQHMKEQGMTQQQAADKMGVTQPRVSDLTRGKLSLFTIDALINMLASLGLQVEITLKEAA